MANFFSSPFLKISGIALATGLTGYVIGKRKSHMSYNQYLFKSHLYGETNPLLKYVCDKSLKLTPAQLKLNEITMKHSQSEMMGAPEVLNLIMILIKATKAKKVLDIGVFTGCSTLAEALALPNDGKVVACDVDDEFVNIGKPFWEEAKVTHKIDLRIQPALTTLDELIKNGEEGTFDFAFVDADKVNYINYYDKCRKLLRKGGILMIDNTLWGAKVLNEHIQDEKTNTIRSLNTKIFQDGGVDVSLLPIGDGVSIVFIH